MKFIHYECLKNWLRVKVTPKITDQLNSYYWKAFECEICKQAYPYILKVNSKIYKLIDIDKPKTGPYIMVESLSIEKNSSRIIHVIKPQSEEAVFKMGRGHDSEVRVNDISVSRTHAILKYRNQNYFIEDNLSKFGTLVQVMNPVELEANHTKAV
jgi:hypothetical protein